MGSNKSKQWEVLNIVPAPEHHYLFCVSIFLINETKIIAFELYSFCVINSMRECKMGKMFHMQEMMLFVVNHRNADSGTVCNNQRARVKLR